MTPTKCQGCPGGEFRALDALRAIRIDPTIETASEVAVLTMLVSYACSKCGRAYPSIRRLSERARCSRRTVFSVLSRAERRTSGLLVDRKSGGPEENNTYTVKVLPLAASKPGSAAIAPLDQSSPSATIAPGVVQPLHQGGATIAPDLRSVPDHVPEEYLRGERATSPPEQLRLVGDANPKSRPKTKAGSKPKSGKPREAPNPDVAVLRDYWVAAYERAKGSAPLMLDHQWGRASKAFATLLKRVSLDDARKAVDNCMTDDWHQRNQPMPWDIANNYSKLRDARPRPATRTKYTPQETEMRDHEVDAMIAQNARSYLSVPA